MQIHAKLVDDTVILKPQGRLMGGPDTKLFTDTVSRFIEVGPSKFVVNCVEVEWTGSTGLGFLLSALRKARMSSGDLLLANVPDKLQSLLAITKLIIVFSEAILVGEAGSYENVTDYGGSDQFKSFVNRQRSANPLISFALSSSDGKFVLMPIHTASVFRIRDGKNFRDKGMLALLSIIARATRTFLREEIEEFEFLVNKDGVNELELQRFLEKHPDFLLGSDYNRVHPSITLYREEGSLIPDFMLEPHWSHTTCDLLDLKLPTERIIVGSENRQGFSAAVMKALYQLREYHDYFENRENRNRILEMHGISAYKPKLYVVIGRSQFIDPLIRAKAESDHKQLRLYTYDEILLRAKYRILQSR
jgi:anti-anti-sigma factor